MVFLENHLSSILTIVFLPPLFPVSFKLSERMQFLKAPPSPVPFPTLRLEFMYAFSMDRLLVFRSYHWWDVYLEKGTRGFPRDLRKKVEVVRRDNDILALVEMLCMLLPFKPPLFSALYNINEGQWTKRFLLYSLQIFWLLLVCSAMQEVVKYIMLASTKW